LDESSPQTTEEVGKDRGFRLRRMSLSIAILAGMVLGIAVGIFFGEYVGFLEVIGNGFIGLLQMTILPHILASLILGIGGLTYDKARLLAVKAGLLLLLTWAIAFAFILLMPLGFPNWESASFYSNALVEFPPPPDFLLLYIPANPAVRRLDQLIEKQLARQIVMHQVVLGVDAAIGRVGQDRAGDEGIQPVAEKKKARFLWVLAALFAACPSEAGVVGVRVGVGRRPTDVLRQRGAAREGEQHCGRHKKTPYPASAVPAGFSRQ
jgi:hypothetical protein